MTVDIGRWRPVQGLFNLYAIYGGLRGLIAGPTPGQAISYVVGPTPTVTMYIFYSSLLIGGATAMIGELRQQYYNEGSLAKYIDGLYVEAAGCFMIALNYGATAIAVYAAPHVPNERGTIFLFVCAGYLGRIGQCVLNSIRIKRKLAEVANGEH